MMNNMRKGFSLIELLIYVSILGVISVLFIGILTTSTKVQVHEVALAEVGNQANFVLQTIQRLVRESSVIEEAITDDPGTPVVNEGNNLDTLATEVAYVKLRMKAEDRDPTCISLGSDKIIYVMQGRGGNPQDCKNLAPSGAIITSKVEVPIHPTNGPGLLFSRTANPPAHDILEVSLTLNHSTSNPGAVFSKTLDTAIGRVSAATFDSDLIPATGNPRSIGQGIARWQNLFVNTIDVSNFINQGGNYNGLGRGFMMIGGEIGQTCDAICVAHGLTCPAWGFYEFRQCTNCQSNSGDYVMRRQGNCATAIGIGSAFPTVTGGLCACQ